jgi:hypothetical protein
MTTASVKRTADFSIFEFHEQNRLLVKDGAFVPRKDLLLSMKQHGFRPSQPISVYKDKTGKLRIFDGHNRFITAQALGLPVCYQVFPEEFAVTPLEYSRGQKAWSMQDVAEAVATENEDYAEVIAYCKHTNVPISSAFSMFAGESASSNNARNKVTRGDFKIADRKNPARAAQVIQALEGVCEFATTRNLVGAISKCLFVDLFHVPRMVDKIERYPELIKKQRSLDEYISMLDLIYNRNSKSDRVDLVDEVRKEMRQRGIQVRP